MARVRPDALCVHITSQRIARKVSFIIDTEIIDGVFRVWGLKVVFLIVSFRGGL